MISFFKRLVKVAVHLLSRFLDRHSSVKHFFIRLARLLGLFNVLYKLNSRASGQQALSPFANHVYTEALVLINNKPLLLNSTPPHKKRLAFVSPLPPLRSGISDYSADLLPLLAAHYDIDVIVDQALITNDWINAHCAIRSADWLVSNTPYYDRVIYHFGNSPFHEYMFDLLDAVPGVVVLHDFFLGHVAGKRYSAEFADYVYTCHGYKAANELQASGVEASIWAYPLNTVVLKNALNVIVHSPDNLRLASQFYGDSIAKRWAVIPLLRQPPAPISSVNARLVLGIDPCRFVVCSFGLTGPIKLSHRLIDAWLASDLANDENCLLVFVGENDAGEYGESLLDRINSCELGSRISITGWVSNDHYQYYLAAADAGIQLRSRSRGETSAAVLDCMNYGLATIVNANGTMVDLPDEAVCKIPDDFDDLELVSALNSLRHDNKYRRGLSKKAQAIILEQHSPQACANDYIFAIELAYFNHQLNLAPLLTELININRSTPTNNQLKALARAVDIAASPRIQQQRLFIDVSSIATEDLRTGIQRVIRSQLEVLLRHPPKGVRVEPVYLVNTDGTWYFYYAHEWTNTFLNLDDASADHLVDFHPGDILFCADLNTGLAIHADSAGLYQSAISSGAKVFFQVFDLLPISHPEWFPSESEGNHIAWANIVAGCSGALCISNAVAEEFKAWCDKQGLPPVYTGYFHLGADIEMSSPSLGMPDNASEVLTLLKSSTAFLMVGTIEPRKGHQQVIAAFDALWQEGKAVTLVIVGKAGWMVDDIINTLSAHPEKQLRLFWLEHTSDEFLSKLYKASNCLIAASEGEGFGLPLIEAAQYGLPIIARDTPVFREVAGEFAHYFDDQEGSDLALSINHWLTLNEQGEVISSQGMPWLTWRQSTKELVNLLGLTFVE